jgi:hypothetical protein
LTVIVGRDVSWEPKKSSEIGKPKRRPNPADRYEHVLEAEREAEHTVTLDQHSRAGGDHIRGAGGCRIAGAHSCQLLL